MLFHTVLQLLLFTREFITIFTDVCAVVVLLCSIFDYTNDAVTHLVLTSVILCFCVMCRLEMYYIFINSIN